VENRETWLVQALLELTDTLTSDFDCAAYANTLARSLAELVAPAEVGLLVSGERSSDAPTTSGTANRVVDLMACEARKGGPLTECCRTGRRTLAQDLRSAGTAWPAFASLAQAAGFQTIATMPIRRSTETVGAIGFVGTTAPLIAEQDTGVAQTLADMAAIGILHIRAFRRVRRTSEQLQHALDSRILIEQAKGVLSAQLGITPDAAFEILRGYSRHNNRRIIDVAPDVIQRNLHIAEPARAASPNAAP
jgi:transcriptional regulator with GAF, ATPase, and Fis domain